MEKIERFSGEFAFLSNFYPSVVRCRDGHLVPTVEHGYQGAKTRMINKRLAIYSATSPGRAKRLGNRVDLRLDWDDVKVEVMRDLLINKFAIPELRELLLDTGGTHLEEGNTWGDRIWGTVAGVGQNLLGRLLMEIRELIQKGEL